MADAMVKYALKHKRLVVAIVFAVFSAGGMFSIARADMADIKVNQETNAKRLSQLESESAKKHTKLDSIAEDVRIIKTVLIGAP